MQPLRSPLAIILLLAFSTPAFADPPLKYEPFDTDPHWQSFHNRITPANLPTVTQDFGYANHEVAGIVTRAAEPAFYADKIPPKTLNDPLTASGTFAFTQTSPGAGCFLGFFRADQPTASGRPVSSLGLDFDTEHAGARLAVRLITGDNQSAGTFITPFLPGKYRPTPIRNDATKYHFTLTYDPHANHDKGKVTFTLHELPKPHVGSASADAVSSSLTSDLRPLTSPPTTLPDLENLPAPYRTQALSHFPATTTFSFDLPDGYKSQPTNFDHFGLINGTKPGGHLTIHIADLAYLDRTQNFATDPHWDARGNRATYQTTDVVGAHNFGYSPDTHFARGAARGEIGGSFWRTNRWAYYADQLPAPLSFDDRLEIRGKIILTVGAPDSDMAFGFFTPDPNSPDSPTQSGPFLGITVGGPTRVGHYLRPAATLAANLRLHLDQGPILTPNHPFDFSLLYDPHANNNNGALTVTLGQQSATLNLKPGQKQQAHAAQLTHFGLLAIPPGGQVVKVYLDDLHYTAHPTP